MSMDDLSPVLNTVAPSEGVTAGAPTSDIPAATEAPQDEAASAAKDLAGRHELATQMVAKLCHDFISPAGAIMSGLDLLEDPSAQDMKQEALNLISTSAKKLVSLVYFARVAFGAANTAEAFNAAQLNKILNDIYASLRAELDFRIEPNVIFEKPAARALLNLGLLAGNSLPMGGKMRLETTTEDGQLIITAEARGPRARLKPEVVEGLSGVPLSDGLAGQWIQPHWLYSVVTEAGGDISWTAETDILILTVKLPV